MLCFFLEYRPDWTVKHTISTFQGVNNVSLSQCCCCLCAHLIFWSDSPAAHSDRWWYYTRLFWCMFTSAFSSVLLGVWPWSWTTEVGRLFSCLGEWELRMFIDPSSLGCGDFAWSSCFWGSSCGQSLWHFIHASYMYKHTLIYTRRKTPVNRCSATLECISSSCLYVCAPVSALKWFSLCAQAPLKKMENSFTIDMLLYNFMCIKYIFALVNAAFNKTCTT